MKLPKVPFNSGKQSLPVWERVFTSGFNILFIAFKEFLVIADLQEKLTPKTHG